MKLNTRVINKMEERCVPFNVAEPLVNMHKSSTQTQFEP